MANTMTIEQALESLSDCYHYEVRVSSAEMPNSCWGKYSRVALMRVVNGARCYQIRETRTQEIVITKERLFDGTSDRCARAKAEAALEEEAERYTLNMHNNRHARQMRAYSASIEARSGEEC